MPLISCVHATRARWDWMWRCRDQWWGPTRSLDTGCDVEWILSMDDDDPLVERVMQHVAAGAQDSKIPPTRLVVGKHAGNAQAWDHAYREADPSSKIIVMVSDDFQPPTNWNAVIAGRLNDAGGADKQFVLGVADPHFTPPYSGDGLLTLFIATRAYLEWTGYNGIFYPEYPSMFSDNDQTDKAALDQVLVDAYDVMFFHHWHGGEGDPLRDKTYYEHATQWHHQTGANIWGDRMGAAFPNVEYADPNRVLTEEEERMCPKGTDHNLHPEGDWKHLCERRASRGYPQLKNKPFSEGDFRNAWIAGDFKAARDGLEIVMGKYFRKACHGRFRTNGGRWLWGYCTEQIGDGKELPREHWEHTGGVPTP